jgi:hypothetical protein
VVETPGLVAVSFTGVALASRLGQRRVRLPLL